MKFYWITLLLYTAIVLYTVLFTEISAPNAFVGGLGVGCIFHIVCLEKYKKKVEKFMKFEERD